MISAYPPPSLFLTCFSHGRHKFFKKKDICAPRKVYPSQAEAEKDGMFSGDINEFLEYSVLLVEGSDILPPPYAMRQPTDNSEEEDWYDTDTTDLFVPSVEDLGGARFSVGQELQMRTRPDSSKSQAPFMAVVITKERMVGEGGVLYDVTAKEEGGRSFKYVRPSRLRKSPIWEIGSVGLHPVQPTAHKVNSIVSAFEVENSSYEQIFSRKELTKIKNLSKEKVVAWNLSTGQPDHIIGVDSAMHSFGGISVSGSYVARRSGKGGVQVWMLNEGTEFEKAKGKGEIPTELNITPGTARRYAVIKSKVGVSPLLSHLECDEFVPKVSKSQKKLSVGIKISSRYRDGNAWYDGIISRINTDGSYDIKYDDGDRESKVPKNRIKIRGDSSLSSTTSQYQLSASEAYARCVSLSAKSRPASIS